MTAALWLGALPVVAALAGLGRAGEVSHEPARAPTVTLNATGVPVARVAATQATATPGCAAATAGARTSSPSLGSPSLVLAGQTSWVRPSGQFVLDLAPTGVATGATTGTTGASSGLSVYVEVFDQLHSRSDFDLTLCNQIPSALIKTFGPVPLSTLAPDRGHPGDVLLPIKVTVPGAPGSGPAGSSNARGRPAPTGKSAGKPSSPSTSATPSNGDVLALSGCASDCTGVYPVQVLLEPKGGTHVLSELTTQLVLTEPASGSKPLALAWDLPVSAPPALTAKGVPTLSSADSTSFGAVASALATSQAVPLTLAPSPITLAALSASTRPADRRTLSRLTAWAAKPSHQVLAQPYGQVSASSLAASGLTSELGPQLQAGAATLGYNLHVHPGTGTWLSQDPLTQSGLAQLAELPVQPVSRIVLSASDLAPLPEQSPAQPQITPIQPFALAGPSGTHVEAVTADPGLASHLVNGPGAVLAAHQLLADLAMIYFDAPNAAYGRGVVLATPASWRPDPAFLGVVLAALAPGSPIIQPVTLDQLFAQTPESRIEPYGGVLVRQLATPSRGVPDLPSASPIRAGRSSLDGYISTLGPGRPPILANMGNLLLAAESTDLSPGAQSAYLSDLSGLIQDQFASVKLQTDTVTLTARTTQLPVTITSALAYPVTGILQIASDKLVPISLGASRPVTLAHSTNSVSFKVRVRATGRFPVQVTLVSPKGGLVLATSRFAVRSSAFSPVAIGITVAAGLVLAGWWGRTLLRGRRNRNRHLVPAGPPTQ